MEYVLCIDETGDFERKEFKSNTKSISSVGGFLTTHDTFKNIKKIRDEIIKDFNAQYEQSDYSDIINQIKPITQKSLHFRNLITGFNKYNMTETWPHSVQPGLSFIVHLLNNLKPYIICACRTNGSPTLNFHPQQNYMVCLISLIVGFLDKKGDIFKRGDKLLVRIAHRSKNVLAGLAEKEPEKYWDIFRDEIEKIIQQHASMIGIKVTIKMGFASNEADLQFADIVLGALINRQTFKDAVPFLYNDTLYTQIPVRDYYYISFGTDLLHTLNTLYKNNHLLEAFLLALDYLASNNEKLVAKSNDFLNKVMDQMLSNDDISLQEAFDTHMAEFLIHRYGDKNELEKLKITAEYIINLINNNSSKNAILLKERCMYYLVNYEAHSGLAPMVSSRNSYSFKYDEFYQSHRVKLSPSLPQRIQKRLETKLIAVQALYFNAFRFEGVLQEMLPDLESYYNTFKEFLIHDEKDDLFARLAGTVGQAQAFCGSWKRDTSLLQKAEKNLLLDIRAVVPNTPVEAQGKSYLLSVYWELDKPAEMMKWIGINNTKDISSFIINQLKTMSKDESNLFVILDYLRFIECCQRNKFIDTLSNEFFSQLDIILESQQHRAYLYPSNLIFKWSALLYHRLGDSAKAQNLLDNAFVDYSDDSIFSTAFPAVNRMMKNIMNGKKPVDDKMKKALTIIADKFPGFQRFAKDKALLADPSMTIEEAARLLPYYYS